MADKNNIIFKSGPIANINTTDIIAGQLLFAIEDNAGSIYFDKDGANRIKLNADALKLANARTINGTSFDGTSNITTANWGTTRTITIGNTGKSVNGSTNYSWTHAEIGTFAAVADSNGYYCIAYPDKSTSNWLRTTQNGIIPYTSGGSSSLGTDSWPFSYVYTNNLISYGPVKIGNNGNGDTNYIAFYGTTGDGPGSYNHTFIGENLYGGTEGSELVLFKGNDIDNNSGGSPGPDRIRHIAAQHLFQTYDTALSGAWTTICDSTVPVTKLEIKSNIIYSYNPIKLGNSTASSQTEPSHYFSTGTGYGTTTGLNGLKILVTQQDNCHSGFGQDLTGKTYELAMAAGLNTDGSGNITFSGHTISNLTSYREAGGFTFNSDNTHKFYITSQGILEVQNNSFTSIKTAGRVEAAKGFNSISGIYVGKSSLQLLIAHGDDMNYARVDSSNTSGDINYIKGAIKLLCANNTGYGGLVLGQYWPNSQGPLFGHIYSTSDTNASTGLPRYSTFIACNLGNSLGIFGTNNYDFYSKAILDSSNYTSYTVKKDGTGASGTWGINVTGSAGSVAWGNVSGKPGSNFVVYYNSNTAMATTESVSAESYIHTVGTTGGSITTATKPSGMDNAWGIIHLHLHSGNYGMQLGFGGTTGHLYQRHAYNSTTFGAWKTILDSSNYTTYTVTKTGGGASGTWGINITGSSASCAGNAATATALTSSAGSSTVPVYFSNGKPVAVGSIWTNSSTSSTSEFNVGVRSAAGTLYMYSTGSATGNRGLYGSNNGGTAKSILTIDSNNNVSLNGNAATATKATQDGSGSTITTTYLKLSGGSMTGAISITTNGVTNSFYSQNSSFTHYSTSASMGHWFNKAVYVQGEIYAGSSYNQKVYHMGNIIYSSTQPTSASAGTIWLKPV